MADIIEKEIRRYRRRDEKSDKRSSRRDYRSRSRSYDRFKRRRHRDRRSVSSSYERRKRRRRKKKRSKERSEIKLLNRMNSYLSADQIIKKVQNLTGKGPEEQLSRELYIGGLPVGMSAPVLVEFMDQAMKKYGFAKSPSERSCLRASLSGDGSFAFVEFATVEEADRCITSLNGVPCLGSPLKIGRPANYTGTGPTTGSFNPNAPILPSLNIDADAAQKLMNQLEEKIGQKAIEPPAKNIRIENMLDDETLANEQELRSIGQEVMEECSDHGLVVKVYVPEVNANDKAICVKFDSVNSATAALDVLNGRTFDGKSLVATFIHDRTFAKLPQTTTSCIPTAELLRGKRKKHR